MVYDNWEYYINILILTAVGWGVRQMGYGWYYNTLVQTCSIIRFCKNKSIIFSIAGFIIICILCSEIAIDLRCMALERYDSELKKCLRQFCDCLTYLYFCLSTFLCIFSFVDFIPIISISTRGWNWEKIRFFKFLRATLMSPLNIYHIHTYIYIQTFDAVWAL